MRAKKLTSNQTERNQKKRTKMGRKNQMKTNRTRAKKLTRSQTKRNRKKV
ncbi:unnamed protein product, partial [Cyprideis torosa]